MILFELFLSFFQVGLFSFGGGFAALPLIQNQVVTIHGWLSLTEFTDLITISQMTPGPIGINAATFVGTQIAGVPGALVATTANILPSIVISISLANIYKKYHTVSTLQGVLNGLRPTVIALILVAGINIFMAAIFKDSILSMNGINYSNLFIFAAALFLLRKFKFDPILIMFISGVLGVFFGII